MQTQIENRLIIFVTMKDHFKRQEENFPYSNYIDYRIFVETKNNKWSVDRRYSNFETLHNELKKKISPLPDFPEKRFFSMSDKTIQERKEHFCLYLNYILIKTNFTTNNILLEFLAIEKELIMMLLKYPTIIHRNTINNSSLINVEKKNRKSKSAKVQKNNLFISFHKSSKSNHIDEFIYSLEENKENICNNALELWQSMKKKKKWEILTRENIIKLFFGNKSTFNKNGLLYHCGNIQKNKLGSEACLDLIAKLVDYETNPDCENCVIILRMSRIEHIEKMNLESHLMSNKLLVTINAFKILKVIIANENELKIDDVLKDKSNIEKFNNFILNNE